MFTTVYKNIIKYSSKLLTTSGHLNVRGCATSSGNLRAEKEVP